MFTRISTAQNISEYTRFIGAVSTTWQDNIRTFAVAGPASQLVEVSAVKTLTPAFGAQALHVISSIRSKVNQPIAVRPRKLLYLTRPVIARHWPSLDVTVGAWRICIACTTTRSAVNDCVPSVNDDMMPFLEYFLPYRRRVVTSNTQAMQPKSHT